MSFGTRLDWSCPWGRDSGVVPTSPVETLSTPVRPLRLSGSVEEIFPGGRDPWTQRFPLDVRRTRVSSTYSGRTDGLWSEVGQRGTLYQYYQRWSVTVSFWFPRVLSRVSYTVRDWSPYKKFTACVETTWHYSSLREPSVLLWAPGPSRWWGPPQVRDQRRRTYDRCNTCKSYSELKLVSSGSPPHTMMKEMFIYHGLGGFRSLHPNLLLVRFVESVSQRFV